MAVERNPLEAMEPELQEEMPVSNFSVMGDTPSIEAEMMAENIVKSLLPRSTVVNQRCV